MRIFLTLLQLCVFFQVSAEEPTPRKIAQTGSDQDISVGWNQISVRTELGDTVTINSCPETGVIYQLVITGKEKIVVDAGLLNQIRYPDLRTLKDIWYTNSLKEISMLRFEFNVLHTKNKDYDGKYKAYILFENIVPEVIIEEFDDKIKGWKKLKQ
jgi:hypothetical protein